MAPPSKLAIATSSLQRLIREEASYHREAEMQEDRIRSLESSTEEENKLYLINQEIKALDETKKLFPGLQQRVAQAVSNLEAQLHESADASEEELTRAKTTLSEGKAALKDQV